MTPTLIGLICSATTSEHNGIDPREFRVLTREGWKTHVWCEGCADVAGRLGLIDRREWNVPVLRERRRRDMA